MITRTPADLTSARRKLMQAATHMQAFNAFFKSWRDRKPYRATQENNADFTEFYLVYRCSEELDVEKLAAIFGDAIHNLRSALDHMAYAIAATNRDSVPVDQWNKIAKGIAFAIFDAPECFDEFKRKFRSVLHSDLLRALELCQPYKRGNEELPPHLALLRDLDDFDKHRLLPVVLSQPVEWKFDGCYGDVPIEAHPIRFIPHQTPAKDGVKLATFIPRCPAPNLHLKSPRVQLELLIEHNAGPTGIVRSRCESIYNSLEEYVRRLMGAFLPAIVLPRRQAKDTYESVYEHHQK